MSAELDDAYLAAMIDAPEIDLTVIPTTDLVNELVRRGEWPESMPE